MSNVLAKTLLGGAVVAVLLAPALPQSKPPRVVPTSGPAASPMKLCIADEFTHGTSTRRQRRVEAELAAVQDWRHNVTTSFGSRYSDIRLASNVYGRCWQEDTGLWSCTAQARPCAPAPGISASLREPAPRGGNSSERN